MQIQEISQQNITIPNTTRPKTFGYKIIGLDEFLKEDLEESAKQNTLPKIPHYLRKLLVKYQNDKNTPNEIINYDDATKIIELINKDKGKILKQLDTSKKDLTHLKIIQEVVDTIKNLELKKERRANRIALIQNADKTLLEALKKRDQFTSTIQGPASSLKLKPSPKGQNI